MVVVADGTSRNQAPTKDLGRVPTLGLERMRPPGAWGLGRSLKRFDFRAVRRQQSALFRSVSDEGKAFIGHRKAEQRT